LEEEDDDVEEEPYLASPAATSTKNIVAGI